MNIERRIETSRLALYAKQKGSGPPLLFLGGSNFDMRLRAPVFDSKLIDHFEVVAFEPRGIGRSDAPDGAWSMADYADDAASILDALNWDKAFVLGDSFGAMTALELAIRHPDRVIELALSAGSAGGKGGHSYPIEELLVLPPYQRALTALSLQDSRFSTLCRTNPTLAEDTIVKRMAFEHEFLIVNGNLEGYRKLLSARSKHDCWDRLEKIEMPVFIMAGKDDKQAGVDLSLCMAQRIYNAKIRTYEGGHGFCFSNLEPIADLITHWT